MPTTPFPAQKQVAAHSRPQIPALTGLRFFAAFFILWGHSMAGLAQFKDSLVNVYISAIGSPGMSLFFVLSGFVIHYNYRDLFLHNGTFRALCEFAAARFARLYPLFFVFLLVALAADNVIAEIDHFPPIIGYYITLTQSWWYGLYDGRLIIYWLFPVSWSISTEMFFYAVYPTVVFLLAAVVRPGRMIWIAALYAGFVMLILILSQAYLGPFLHIAQAYVPGYLGLDQGDNSFYRWFFYLSPYTRVLEFLLGCMTAQAVMQLNSSPTSAYGRRWASFAASAALVYLLLADYFEVDLLKLWVINGYVHHLYNCFLAAPAIAVILFCVARYDFWLNRLLAFPALVLLGEMSYSIYLVHTWTLRIFQHPPRALTPFGILDAVWCVVCGIAITVLLSYGTYNLIEMPARRWLRNSLGAAISFVFKTSSRPRVSRLAGVRGAKARQFAFSISAPVILAAIVVGGEAAKSERIAAYVHNLIYHRSEVVIISASYGLNCRTFPVKPPALNRASEGNVTEKIERLCHFSPTCDIPIDAGYLGDVANGCPKDFTVEYQCTGRQGLKTGYIPAEAHGKHIALGCSADTANVTMRPLAVRAKAH